LLKVALTPPPSPFLFKGFRRQPTSNQPSNTLLSSTVDQLADKSS
jgi:hypothetical protein